MSVLETHDCWNCQKPTVVARITPCNQSDKLTGMWLSRMSNDFGEKTIGVLCKECAFTLCDAEKVMLGFGGGRLGNLANWDAILEEVETKP